MDKRRNALIIVLAAGLLLAFVSLAAAGNAGPDRDISAGERASAGYSGDDAYDPAASGFPELFVAARAGSYSGDDAYDPATGARPERSLRAGTQAEITHGSFSGDDVYDPAAGAHPKLSLLAWLRARKGTGSYSGDDTYDPAAGRILGR